MSTGRRLAKRSIIGTKVCAPGPDGLWYSGVIQDVKTPPTATITSASCSSVSVSASSSSSSSLSSLSDSPNGTNITADTKYIVRFDFKTQSMQSSLDGSPASKSVIMEARRAANAHISPTQTLRRNAMIKEFRESDLIGPGFRSILGIQLQPGQRVFLTYNGRETSGDVLSHDANKDEVVVKIMATGTEDPIELKKRLEEVRLLESRRSARLADQERDTDFARLADMGSGDRRRTTSHSIDVPSSLTPSHNPRKRPPPYTHDCTSGQCKEEMDECNAALILMNLSNSPTSPKNAEKWLGSSPGSSSASWSSGSSSPPLSDDGHALNTSAILNDATARIRTTSVSTSDEGIVVDYKDNKDYKTPRKKKANKSRFLCTWKGCKFIESTPLKIERHIRTVHLGNKKARRSVDYDGSCSENDHEEEFYYTEIEDDDDEGKAPSPTSPPTLSHRDMARPPHEDPEYQRQIVKQGRASQHQQQLQQQHHHTSKTIYQSGSYISTNSQQQQHHAQSNCMSASPLAHHNYTWPSSTTTVAAPTSSTSAAPTTAPQSHSAQQQQQQQFSPASLIRHARASPRPSQSAAPYPSPPYAHHNQQQQQQHHHQHHNYSSPHASVSNSNGGSGSGSGSSNTNHCAPIIHGNSSANNMLQQLSQQNVTVTARHSGIGSSSSSGNHSQQQHQVPAVTITPNYHPQTQPPHPNSHQQHHHQTQQQSQSQPQPQPPQQHMRGHHQTPHSTTASNIVALQQHAHAAPTHAHQQHPQHAAVQHAVTAAAKATPNSPNRRTRGENKKCRKVYGMERREQWCTQCRWKKACTRFGD